METWAPETYGLKLQREYTISPSFQVEEDQRELGNIKSVAVASKALRAFKGLQYIVPSREAYEYAVSFWNRNKGPAARVLWSLPELVPSPDAAPTLTAVISGAQAQRTIIVKYVWKNSAGLTRASPANSLLVPVNNLIRVTLPTLPPGVAQATIYATQGSAGTEQEQTTLTNTRTWTQPDAALLLATTSPPTKNTATEIITVKLVSGYQVTRLAGVNYSLQLELEEAY